MHFSAPAYDHVVTPVHQPALSMWQPLLLAVTWDQQQSRPRSLIKLLCHLQIGFSAQILDRFIRRDQRGA